MKVHARNPFLATPFLLGNPKSLLCVVALIPVHPWPSLAVYWTPLTPSTPLSPFQRFPLVKSVPSQADITTSALHSPIQVLLTGITTLLYGPKSKCRHAPLPPQLLAHTFWRQIDPPFFIFPHSGFSSGAVALRISIIWPNSIRNPVWHKVLEIIILFEFLNILIGRTLGCRVFAFFQNPIRSCIFR
jgi:hypothetical protein